MSDLTFTLTSDRPPSWCRTVDVDHVFETDDGLRVTLPDVQVHHNTLVRVTLRISQGGRSSQVVADKNLLLLFDAFDAVEEATRAARVECANGLLQDVATAFDGAVVTVPARDCGYMTSKETKNLVAVQWACGASQVVFEDGVRFLRSQHRHKAVAA